MVGAVSEDKNAESSLWNESGIANTRQPIISNITVNQTAPIDTKEQSGVGFFGSIMSKSTKNLGTVDQQVAVKNIKLQNVSITNSTSEIKDNTGLIQGLLDLLKPILGGLLGNLGEVLGDLLNPNGEGDPVSYTHLFKSSKRLCHIWHDIFHFHSVLPRFFLFLIS